MLCPKCSIDMAVREVFHELTQQDDCPSLALVQQLCCPKCKQEQLLRSPLQVNVKNV